MNVEKVNRIPMVQLMLEVICRVTGMGFAAIARVTEDKWIACSVRDEIDFGLKPGGELPLETTICNEIRQHKQPVLIENVSEDEIFCNHNTPRLYGFQSYISLPIILNTGEFFGTLCAIDPQPRKVKDVKIAGMFSLFSQLIAFQLHSLDLLDQSNAELAASNGALSSSLELLQTEKKITRYYEHLTYHTLREPVRKMAFYSDMLVNHSISDRFVQQTAAKLHTCSTQALDILREIVLQENTVSGVENQTT